MYKDHITPVGSTLPAVFAKSSTVWSTVFYIFSNKNIKSKMSFNRSSEKNAHSIKYNKRSGLTFNKRSSEEKNKPIEMKIIQTANKNNTKRLLSVSV